MTHTYPDWILMSIVFFETCSVDRATPQDGCEVDAVDQVVERALVDQPRDIAFDRRLGIRNFPW
jgi:hypothetical protein